MKQDSVKLELIEWICKLEDEEIIYYLKAVKDSNVPQVDWWDELNDEQKSDIEQGLKDVDEGRVIPHEEVKRKYRL